MQTRFHGDPLGGNCTEAAIASLLGISLEDVGDLARDKSIPEHWMAVDDVFKRYGFELVRSDCKKTEFGTAGPRHYDGYYLVSGKTNRFNGTVSHMVLYHNFNLIHDPHPDGTGLINIEHTYVAIPFDPGVQKQSVRGLTRWIRPMGQRYRMCWRSI